MKTFLIISLIALSFFSYGNTELKCRPGEVFDSNRGVCVEAEIVTCRVSSINSDGSKTEFIDVDLKTSRIGLKVSEYIGINGYTLAFNFHKQFSNGFEYSIVTHMSKEGERSVGATATSKTLPVTLAVHDTNIENDTTHTLWIVCGDE